VSPVGAIVLAHNDPAKVRRLLGALQGIDVVLHCDRRTPRPVLEAMMPGGSREVRIVPSVAARLSTWSLVEAELRAVRLWLQTSRAEHVILLSGACYPLVSVAEIEDELDAWRGLTRIRLNPLPYAPWRSPLRSDGGLWRVQRRFLTFRGQIVTIHGYPVPTARRPVPKGLTLRASSQWKIYSRRHAGALLRAFAEHPELERFWRTTFVPDESCVASVLSSPELVGDACEGVCDDLPWYIDWSRPTRGRHAHGHPRWLGMDDLPALEAARRAPARPLDRVVPGRDGYRKLFARKIASGEMGLLDAIDSKLRA
jgi:hypothetical protein